MIPTTVAFVCKSSIAAKYVFTTNKCCKIVLIWINIIRLLNHQKVDRKTFRLNIFELVSNINRKVLNNFMMPIDISSLQCIFLLSFFFIRWPVMRIKKGKACFKIIRDFETSIFYVHLCNKLNKHDQLFNKIFLLPTEYWLLDSNARLYITTRNY